MLYERASRLLLVDCWFGVVTDFIYLVHREFQRQLSLCVSRWAFPTIMLHPTNSGRPIQLTPFASNLWVNQTKLAEVGWSKCVYKVPFVQMYLYPVLQLMNVTVMNFYEHPVIYCNASFFQGFPFYQPITLHHSYCNLVRKQGLATDDT